MQKKNRQCNGALLQSNRNKPIDSVAGRTSSSGTGPGIADGLQLTSKKNHDTTIQEMKITGKIDAEGISDKFMMKWEQ